MGTTTYDKLSRGRKQEIDLERRKKLTEVKATPKSRAGDTVVDAARAANRLIGGATPGSARAEYAAARSAAIGAAQDKADYKDLKSGPTKLFKDKNAKGMSAAEMSKLGDFKVEKYKNGGAVGATVAVTPKYKKYVIGGK